MSGPEVVVADATWNGRGLGLSLLAVFERQEGAYLPLVPVAAEQSWPSMIETGQAAFSLITTSPRMRPSHGTNSGGAPRQEQGGIAGAEYSADDPRRGRACTPCLILFTSGSTGQPKGVEIEHRAFDELSSIDAQRAGDGAGAM